VQRIVNTVFCNAGGTGCQTTQFITNAGKVNTYGLEFEGALVPWRGMTIDANAAYLHAAYVEGTRTETQLVGGVPVQVDRAGEPVTQAPKWTASVGGTQIFDLADNRKLSLHADYSYMASRYFDYFTQGVSDPTSADQLAAVAATKIANQASKIHGYGLLNATITYTLKDYGLELSLWGKNLTDKPWFTNLFNSYTGIGAAIQSQGAPRTFGGTVSYHW
jgi:iron complex outermembrane receptor protein